MKNQHILLLLKFVQTKAMLAFSEPIIKDQADWASSDFTGNYDDCFDAGQIQANAATALEAREILQKIASEREPNEQRDTSQL